MGRVSRSENGAGYRQSNVYLRGDIPRNAHGYWLAGDAAPTGKRGNAPGKGKEKMWAWVSVAKVKVLPGTGFWAIEA